MARNVRKNKAKFHRKPAVARRPRLGYTEAMTGHSDFETLSPELVLRAAERAVGAPLEPMVTPYNSYVNRVYGVRDESGARYIAKFYRPGRWTAEAIAEEHRFLADCAEAELPIVAPLPFADATALAAADCGTGTLGTIEGYAFACYPFRGGRTFDITGDEDYLRLGGLIGRLHTVAQRRAAPHRPVIDPIAESLRLARSLAASEAMNPDARAEFLEICEATLTAAESDFAGAARLRLHGECHRGNILDRGDEGLLLIDFDDMATGPAIQDLWLLLPDRLDEARREMGLLIEDYERFRSFDRGELRLVESLRFMRMVHYLGWQARQAGDERFARDNPDWGTRAFWLREIDELRTQAAYLRPEATD